LKQFMKGIGVYGSELRRRGFSGYLTELLVINYGSFLGVLKEASSIPDIVHIAVFVDGKFGIQGKLKVSS